MNKMLKNSIEEKILELEYEYQNVQGLILTEADLKCLVYNKLIQIQSFNKKYETEDKNTFTKPVHSEIHWYDENEKLSIVPDITILDPNKLSIYHRYGSDLRLPSKQFEFDGSAILMELKYIRNKSGITSRTFNGRIIEDFNKIKRLYIKFRKFWKKENLYCYFIICNKTNNICSEFNQFLLKKSEGDWYKYLYFSGNVTFD